MMRTTNRIGFCGTVSIGKTTLVKELGNLSQFKGYNILTERSKYLHDLGIPLNTDSTVRGQFIFMAERASELLHPNILTDRTIWDVCAFTMTASSIDEESKSKLIAAATCLMPYYDIVFYIKPDGVKIEDNGFRTIDPEYRDKIDENIKYLLKLYPPTKLVEISGPHNERMETIMGVLQNL